ncbi:MAG TPA: hypothetical protein GX713_01695 [Mollicutes bacterium]|nr:hypothetical protein [Mollicutes bacterium]
MDDSKNIKKLSIILGIIFSIIILILILYITSEFLNIKQNDNDDNIYTTTTKAFKKEIYNDLNEEQKIFFNTLLNEENTLRAFNNLIKENIHLDNINLLQNEVNKFKFIYTYLDKESLSFEEINENSKLLFDVHLYENNLNYYLDNDLYKYEYEKEIEYCFKSSKENEEYLIIDLIKYDAEICKNDVLNYSDIFRKVKLKYKLNESNLIYDSFIIEKKGD